MQTNLLKPKAIQVEQLAANRAKVTLEPFERGYGHTLGNALRRVLLSSLQGAAVVSVRFEGASHEFSTLEGVKEDVSEIILNLKRLRVKLLSDEDATLRIDVSGEGEVRAEHIEQNPAVKILNPDLHIATLSKNGNLTVELRVSDGRGYVSAEELKREDDPIGVIPIDADFSPVSKVSYEVTDTRVGQRTDFNRLEIEIWTDGSIEPEDAMAYAAKLLVDHVEERLVDAPRRGIDARKERRRGQVGSHHEELVRDRAGIVQVEGDRSGDVGVGVE